MTKKTCNCPRKTNLSHKNVTWFRSKDELLGDKSGKGTSNHRNNALCITSHTNGLQSYTGGTALQAH